MNWNIGYSITLRKQMNIVRTPAVFKNILH